ncbi:hypothetical protein [Flavobacterium dankookense]|uniref:Uncharacterized protein n=1 Tax=Flavobacterium dankookense TaxID=706186 RepID=A0A4R6QF94_9FLAO|nr:hypothetical protein [Flavobacterium dankookense]TDP60947.1 hypothetical protein BC748_0549 [Flavobacterium dankookense]
MALDRIEKLIEKYFEGETSSAEEKELKDYFSSSDVAQHLEHYQPLFGYFSQAKQEQFTATIPLHTKKQTKVVWLSVAASLVVMLAVGVFAYQGTSEPKHQDLGVIEDPEIAFRETQKALALISKHVNTGIESVNYLSEYEQSKNKIFK